MTEGRANTSRAPAGQSVQPQRITDRAASQAPRRTATEACVDSRVAHEELWYGQIVSRVLSAAEIPHFGVVFHSQIANKPQKGGRVYYVRSGVHDRQV